jgi:uncharacterized membrane protein
MRSAVIGAVMLLAACGEDMNPKKGDGTVIDAAAPAAMPSPEEVSASDTSPVELNMRFQALGTEPFWSVKLVPNTATYTTPEDQKGTPAQYDFTFNKDTLRYEWKQDARSFVLIITKGTCSDGMSDTVYAWKATLTIDGKAEQGCARQS